MGRSNFFITPLPNLPDDEVQFPQSTIPAPESYHSRPFSATCFCWYYDEDRVGFAVRHDWAKYPTAECSRDFTVPSGIFNIALISLYGNC
jgi:hypothetical protein